MISFTCRASLLSSAFSTTSKAASQSAKNGNQSVKATLEGSTLTLIGTGPTLTIIQSLEVIGKEDGVVLFPKEMFEKILKSLDDDDEIEIKEKSNRMRIESGSAQWDCNTGNPDEFPGHEDGKEGGVRIAKSALVKLVERTAYSVDDGKGKISGLSGVNVEVGDEWFEMVASDGRRLSSQKVKFSEGSGGFSGIIPADSLRMAVSTFGDDDLWMNMDRSSFTLRDNRTTMIGRLVEGKFPRWKAVVQDCERKFGVLTKGFLKSITQAAIAKNESSNAVAFEFRDGYALISGTRETGNSSVRFNLGWTYDDEGIRIDPDYLAAAIRPLGLETLNLAIENNGGALVIETEDGFWGRIMANVMGMEK